MGIYTVNTCIIYIINWEVAVVTAVCKGPYYFAFKVVAETVVTTTTENAREYYGLMHSATSKPTIGPSPKEAHGHTVRSGGEMEA